MLEFSCKHDLRTMGTVPLFAVAPARLALTAQGDIRYTLKARTGMAPAPSRLAPGALLRE